MKGSGTVRRGGLVSILRMSFVFSAANQEDKRQNETEKREKQKALSKISAQAQIYHALCDVPLLPLIFFSRSFPALFWEEGTKQPQEVCHFLADTASEEQAVSATEVLAPWKVCRQQFAEQPRYCRVSYCVFSCPLHRSPHSQPLPKSCSGTCLCLVKLILSYRIVVPK